MGKQKCITVGTV